MLNKAQSLEAGDSSINNQAGNITQVITINKTIPKEEAKEILVQIFQDNMPKLAQEARLTAGKRADEISNKILEKMSEKAPDLINTFKDPDMQYALLTAQITHARLGDDNIADLMVDVLVERASHQNRDLQQIVLNEVLSVLQKLNSEHLDVLSLVFLNTLCKFNKTNDIAAFKNVFSTYYYPLLDKIPTEESCYQHLIYSGCTSLNGFQDNIVSHHKKNYKRFFCKGFPIDDFSQIDNTETAHTILEPCMHNPLLSQININNNQSVENLIDSKVIDANNASKIKALYNSSLMSDDEAKTFLLSFDSKMQNMLDLWKKTNISGMSLTSVGIAIAVSNLKKYHPKIFQLSTWIK